MEYKEAIDYLYATAPMFQRVGAAGYKEGLGGMQALDELLGHPHRAFRTIHVGGTNGKGSVAQMLYSVLREAGYRTGLYTSPHLRDFRERIVVDGEMIPEADVARFIETYRADIERLKPSFFEITTALAFGHFRAAGVEIAVIEVGLGGRLDSTNIITPLLSVITNISFDHKAQLGDTLGKIAAEKAGIIKEGVPVVVGEWDPATAPVFIQQAREKSAPLCFASQRYRCVAWQNRRFEIENRLDGDKVTLELGMSGPYQRLNICTALAALDLLSEELTTERISPGAVCRGLENATVRGRWEILAREPLTVCDTGHNEAGIREVCAAIERLRGENAFEHLYIVLGAVADKDLVAVLKSLPYDAYYFFTQPSIPRALPAEELAAAARAEGLDGETVPTVARALAEARRRAAPRDMIFVGGSTFVVADIPE